MCLKEGEGLHLRKADGSAESRKQELGWTRRLPCLALQGYLLWGINILMCRTVYAADIFEIVVCWAVLMTLGTIVTYMEVIIPQQSFTP